jgi:1-acyl-sn-glycerol-3-phosphate acyltransferase
MDVLAIHQAIASPRCSPLDGFRANVNLRFVAAYETLNERGLMPRIFNYAGAVLIRRTWRDGDRDLQRPVNPEDIRRVGTALRNGWLLTFPQGTTTPQAPVRKGTAHIIREHMPVVVPILLDGFDRAFSKKGFEAIEKGVDLVVKFGAPLAIRADDTIERILEILTAATSAGSPVWNPQAVPASGSR